MSFNCDEHGVHRATPSKLRREWLALHRILVAFPFVFVAAACSNGGNTVTGPALAALYVLPSPVVLDASAAGKIVLVSSKISFNADHTWAGRDTVTNTEAGSGVPEELTGSGTYSISDSTLLLHADKGAVTQFLLLNGGAELRRLSTFERLLVYKRLGSTTPL